MTFNDALPSTFNVAGIEPATSFDPLPAGWYAMQAIETEVRGNSSGTGTLACFTFEVMEAHHPEHKGRRVWSYLNITHQKQTVQEIGMRELAALCRACGKDQVERTSELLNTPIAVKVGIRAARGEYDASNETKGFEPIGQRFTQAASSSPTPSKAAPAGGSSPWSNPPA